MEENELVEHKLSFFQRIRKRFYLNRMRPEKAEKYSELPDALKLDEEVIRAVVQVKPELLNTIPFAFAQKLITENPALLTYIRDLDKTQTILETQPEAITNLNEEVIYNLIFNQSIKGDKSFISKLPMDFQKKLLSEPVEFIQYEKNYSTGNYRKTQSTYKNHGDVRSLDLKLFSDDAILAVAVEDIEEMKKGNRSSLEYTRIYKLDISKMNVSAQLKLMLLDDRYMEKASHEAIDLYIQDNPLLIEKAPFAYKKEYVEKHRDRIALLPSKIQSDALERDKYMPNAVKTSEMSVGFRVTDFPDTEDAKKRLVKEGFMTRSYGSLMGYNITDIRRDDYIFEMGKFAPGLLEIRELSGFHDIAPLIRANKLCQNYHRHLSAINPYGPVTKFFEKYVEKNTYNPANPTKDWKQINALSKFILNDDVITRVPQEELMDYVNEPSNEKLAAIVRKTYGEKAAQIVLDRPQIGIDDIPNLYIFHPTIIENFGIGATHATLAYNMNTSAMFSEFARNPEMLARYKKFKEFSGEIFEDTAIDLDKSMDVFVQADTLIKSLNGRQLTDEQKRLMQMAIVDAKTDNTKEVHNAIPFPKTIEELDQYEANKDKLYDDAIQKTNDPERIKELISQKYFGMRYTANSHDVTLDDPTVVHMCYFYKLHDFVHDKKIIETGKFTQDDLDALELLDIIREIKDVDVLKDLAGRLSKQKDIINPSHYQQLKKNVPLMYSQEMVQSLTTVEQVEDMIARGEEGISIREEDGVKIITLEGADFKSYVSNPYMNNSEFIQVNHSSDVPEVWQTTEGGISTFSGCLVDPATIEQIHAVDKTRPNLGFYSIKPDQIVGMGATDIHVSHGRKELRPSSTEYAAIRYGFSDQVLDKTADRFFGQGDPDVQFHHYNEVAAERRLQKLSEIQEGTNGGKTNPDFLFVYGRNGSSAIEMAKKFGVDVIFEYDSEVYKNRAHEFYWRRKQEQKQEAKENNSQSQFISEVRDIVKGDDSNDGR